MDQSQIGSFRVLEHLGAGGMGEVRRAFDTMLEREVALKTLHPAISMQAELVERFRVEAIALARLHHPRIAAVHAFFQDQGRHHMVMQFVPGCTLDALLRQRGRLTWPEVAAIARDVLQALVHAHAQGVIHRDLKPANLMLDPAGRVVVTDFGIARVLERSPLTHCGHVVGTPAYMAPEVVMGAPEIDGRADLYALGVVMYELLTGRLPFSADTDFALMRAQIEDALPAPATLCADLPAPAEALILRALAKQPHERWADAQAFLEALVEVTGLDAEVPAPTVRRAMPTGGPSGAAALGRPASRSLLAGLSSLGGLALVAALIGLSRLVSPGAALPERLPATAAPMGASAMSAPTPGTVSAPIPAPVIERQAPLPTRAPQPAAGDLQRIWDAVEIRPAPARP